MALQKRKSVSFRNHLDPLLILSKMFKDLDGVSHQEDSRASVTEFEHKTEKNTGKISWEKS